MVLLQSSPYSGNWVVKISNPVAIAEPKAEYTSVDELDGEGKTAGGWMGGWVDRWVAG